MGKRKATIENFLSNNEPPKVPTSSRVEEKQYSKHKIFDKPETTYSNMSKSAVIEIDTALVFICPHKVDRRNLTDTSIFSLAENMAKVGQAQPCMVRESNAIPGKQYELVFGERRFKAAKLKGMKLKVIVKDITDNEAALFLLSENNNRKNNTDFELSSQLCKLFEANIVSQQEIVDKIGISRQKLSRLLSYERIPFELVEAIHDFTRVSSATAEYIASLSKETSNIPILIEIADKIRSGMFGKAKVKEYVFNHKNKQNPLLASLIGSEIFDHKGRLLYKWEIHGDSPSIVFSKKLSEHHLNNEESIKIITAKIKEALSYK